jgi:hypothetical protein
MVVAAAAARLVVLLGVVKAAGPVGQDVVVCAGTLEWLWC